MKTKLSFVAVRSLLIAAALTFADPARAAEDAAERKRLEGTWVGGVVEGDGSRPNSTRARISELVITADRITAKDGQGTSLGAGAYRLGQAGNLRTIDAAGTDGQVRNKQYLGIYVLDGDTLKWCSANPGRARPTQFKSTPPDGFLMILTRKK